MTEHLRDCPLSQPCIYDGGSHAHVQRFPDHCANCLARCICERLRAHGKRVLADAREAVAAIADMDAATVQTDALAAIDRLIEADDAAR